MTERDRTGPRDPEKPGDSGGEEEEFSYFDRWFQESGPVARRVAVVLLILYLLALLAG